MNWMVTMLMPWWWINNPSRLGVVPRLERMDDMCQAEGVSCRSRETYELAYVEERAFWGYGGNLSGP